MKIDIVDKTSSKVLFKKIEKAIIDTLKKHNASDNSEISVVIVNDDEMYKYAKKYLAGETEEELKSHPVLSFPNNEIEGEFVMPEKHKNYLGEIIISFEKAKTEKGVCDLAEHATLHLIGIHHC